MRTRTAIHDLRLKYPDIKIEHEIRFDYHQNGPHRFHYIQVNDKLFKDTDFGNIIKEITAHIEKEKGYS